MITPAFGLTATERVLPKLALDFTTASLDSRITFTRTTGASNPATYVSSNGYITAATNNQPRFDYNPVTLACKGLLIEESRANIALQSEDFATTWTLTAATLSADATNSPANTLTADKLIATTATTTHLTTQVITGANNTTYTFSCYIKAGEYATAGIGFQGNGVFTTPGTQAIVINLTTGAISAGTGSPSSTVTNAGNGWWRVSITAAGGTNSPSTVNPYIFAINGTTYADRLLAGNGTSGIYIWGAQLEAGAFATSYIPTTTTALTRNADVATMTGTNFSDWFNASEGAFVAEAIVGQAVATSGLVCASDGTTSNRIQVRKSTTQGVLVVVAGGSVQTSLANGTWTSTTEPKKCAAAYKQNLFGVATDAAATTIGFGTVPTVNQLEIGFGIGSNYVNGWMRKIQYYPQRLINSEVQAFSK